MIKNKAEENRIRIMLNPWEEIALSDYENHMKLDSVMQLQSMNQMMKNQFDAYTVSSVMVLGIAGGNGLEHIDRKKYQKVYGIDINRDYLAAVKERYSDISDILECIQINLMEEADRLPKAELLLANLLIEYIGYDCFSKIVGQVQPGYVSCIIQINTGDSWVSDSPYIHVFDNLDKVHHQIEAETLIQTLKGIGYQLIAQIENPLPNQKKLMRLDFAYSRKIDKEVSLVKYYPDDTRTLEWYQDLDVCRQVDNRDEAYDLKLLKQMYQYLAQKGQLFYIEYQNQLCGDVCLQDSGEINIVIAKPYQNKHIGRRVINEMIKMAREHNMKTLHAQIYDFNHQSQRMFESVGFVKAENDDYILGV